MVHKNRVIIVTELFYPEESATAYVMTCIANYLAKNWDVLVLAGPELYEGDKNRLAQNNEFYDSFRVKRVWAPSLNKNNIFYRVVRVLILSIGLATGVFKISRSSDVVFAVTNPASLPVLLALIKRAKKFKFVLLVHDVFPENAVSVGLLKPTSKVFKLAKRVFDCAYKSANLIITIGRDMSDVIMSKAKCKSDKICLIENWADICTIHPVSREDSKIAEWGLRDKLVIQYAGNVGRAQGILNLSDALKCINNQAIHFTFVGSGAAAAELREKLKGIENVTFSGSFARSDQNAILGSCDIAFVILGERMYGLGVPSKTYNIMAAGKPILYLGPRDSEIYRLVNENDIGWAFSWDKIQEMIDFVNSLTYSDIDACRKIGLKARFLAETNYSEPLQMRKYSDAVELLMSKP